jgi:hypothetical protein
VLFRSITRFWALKKPCYLENRVVREPRKRRSACIILAVRVTDLYFCQLSQKVLIDETLQYSSVSQYF